MTSNEREHTIEELKRLMQSLRDEKSGCPWDIEQTFASIAPHTVEEAYEVVDAILKKDMEHLKEELGDLLFQVIFHSQMASEAGYFDFDDVVHDITEKMIRRHPHVFSDAVIATAAEQEEAWEKLKAEEKGNTGTKPKGILADVPAGLPAMLRAYKIQKKVAKVGFDWPSVDGVYEKIEEELVELKEEVAAKETKEKNERIIEEMGDLLFAVINLARKLKVEPEMALAKTNHKFERRFAYIEEQLHQQGESIEESTLGRMDALWEEAKTRF